MDTELNDASPLLAKVGSLMMTVLHLKLHTNRQTE